MLWWRLRQLKSSDAEKRRLAVERLGNSRDAKSIEPLISALSDSDYFVRRESAKALGKINDLGTVQSLISATKDSDSSVRSEAVAALGKMGAKLAVDSLIAALKDSEARVRSEAAIALGKIADPVAIAPLIDALIVALMDSQEDVCVAAQNSLKIIGTSEALDAVEAYQKLAEEHRQQAQERRRQAQLQAEVSKQVSTLIARQNWDGIVKMGSIAVKTLIPMLKDPDVLLPRKIAEMLGKIGDVSAVEPLIAALKDDYRAQREAAWALGQIGDARAVAPLIDALKSSNKQLRYDAAKSLGDIRDARAIKPLIAALRDIDSMVQYAAVEALGEIGGKQATEALNAALKGSGIAALEDKEKFLRSIAIKTLRNSGDARTEESLIAVLRASDPWAQTEAAISLGKLKAKNAVGPLFTLLIKTLDDAQINQMWYLKLVHALAKALTEIGDKQANQNCTEILLQRIHPPYYKVHAAIDCISFLGGYVSDLKPLVGAFIEFEARGGINNAAYDALKKVRTRNLKPVLEIIAHDKSRLPVPAVEILEHQLKTFSADILEEDLRAIVQLQKVMSTHVRFQNEAVVSRYWEEVPVDISRLRQLARQELMRRGIETG
jgi:HEAT repeat protein